ncbi:hypothetical protein BC834DRAFT_890353 [Gloeopeniophorella convolvens]|nr:hypothetical protein BC834DRAFT_890353 [Gloeopeniophorella convolvens]
MSYESVSSQSSWSQCSQVRFDTPDRVESQLYGSDLPNSGYETRHRLSESEFDAINTAVQHAKARRNAAVCPVYRLPDELLCFVFEAWIDLSITADPTVGPGQSDFSPEIADPPASSYYGSSSYGPDWALPEWIACSQVCQRWRSVALGAPSLWRNILVGFGPSWVQRCLARSGTMPGLRILGHLPPPYYSVATLPPSGLSRVKALVLRADSGSSFRRFLTQFEIGAPSLKHVELFATNVEDPSYYEPADSVISLDTLVRHSSALRHVSLTSMFAQWGPLFVPTYNLTYLSVTTDTHTPYQDVSPAFVEDAVEFLKSTPALRTLVLIGAFTTRSGPVQAMAGVAELSHLQDFVWADGLGDQIVESLPYFLEHVSYPVTCQVRIQTCDLRMDQILPLVRRTLRYFEGTGGDGTLALLRLPYWLLGVQLIAHRTPWQPVAYHLRPFRHDVDVNISFRDMARGTHKATIFRAACRALPPLFARTLIVEDPELWDDLAERFPSARVITCCTSAPASTLCLILSPPEGGPVVFPELQELRLWSIRGAGVGESLLSALRARKEQGLAIRKVIFDSCTMDDIDIDAICEVVDYVHVEHA